MTTRRKKLIEVSMPLEAINKASAKEKSIRHGHPSTLHLWWARRPLAACRAVLFAQLVDDPSSWPEEFPTQEDQERERSRLHRLIGEMVPWKATNDEAILNKVRCEIARSIARGRGDEPPVPGDPDGILAYLAENAPPVCDPFCGGGSIPLEAQRLGLRGHGSDINPVAVLVSKATCEIPPKFAGRRPVNPERSALGTWRGAQGLAEDIRYYGKWMRDEAEARIGHLYPKVKVTKGMATERKELKPYVGEELTVMAWIWARTVASPDPKMRGEHVPLANSYVLGSQGNNQAIIVPEANVDRGRYRFTVKGQGISQSELRKAQSGTKAAHGANFTCLLSGTPISSNYIKTEANAGRMGMRLMAAIAEGRRSRVYVCPNNEMEEAANAAEPSWRPTSDICGTTQYLGIKPYGISRFDELFVDRQLVAMTTFSELVAEARKNVYADAHSAGMESGKPRLFEGGSGAEAYADAVATYLGIGIGRAADFWNCGATWQPGGFVAHAFTRQAIQMTWDFAESNPFSTRSGNWNDTAVGWTARATEYSPASAGSVSIIQHDAADNTPLVNDAMVATDPPYYDNVPYADISDFFYVWLRRTLQDTHPNLFRRLLTPKEAELVAFAYRHNGKEAADQFFMDGMTKALRNMHQSAQDEFPVTIFYAFKQAEVAAEGLTSPGWATFLQSIVDVGYAIDGTWPVRTERAARSRGIGSNALASSIVLVCRKRPPDAPALTRREFVAQLRAKLQDGLRKIRGGGVSPVDIAQAALGPGMGVFTATSKVLEPDDTPMTVRTAIALINQVRDEISGEEATSYDADTRFCIDWFDAFAFENGDSGDAITMAQAYNIGIHDLETAGVFRARGGRARLLQRNELAENWDPAEDDRLTDWECAQHLARALEAADGGIEAAAQLYAKMDADRSDSARMLAYRIYDICDRKGRAQEAQTWNMLAQEWPALESAAAELDDGGETGPMELGLTGGG